jgi:hypothetical protein
MFAMLFKHFHMFFFKCLRSIFQLFHLSSQVRCKCCIWIFSKVDRVLHMCMGSGRGREWPRAQSGGTYPAWARESQVQMEACWCERGVECRRALETECSAGLHLDVKTLALP